MDKKVIDHVLSGYDDMKAVTEILGDYLVIGFRDWQGYPQIDYRKVSELMTSCQICEERPAVTVREFGGCATAPHEVCAECAAVIDKQEGWTDELRSKVGDFEYKED